MIGEDINALGDETGAQKTGGDPNELLKAKIAERKQNLLKSKLSKKVLGTDKKLRTTIERTELKMKAARKFNNYVDELTLEAPA